MTDAVRPDEAAVEALDDMAMLLARIGPERYAEHVALHGCPVCDAIMRALAATPAVDPRYGPEWDGPHGLCWTEGTHVHPVGQYEPATPATASPSPDDAPTVAAQSAAPAVDEAMDAVYADRNLVVQAFGWAMEQAGYPVAWGEDWGEPDWPVLYIETPQGQVSWHIPRAERVYEPPVRPEHGPVEWDGHTNEQKADRLRRILAGSDQ